MYSKSLAKNKLDTRVHIAMNELENESGVKPLLFLFYFSASLVKASKSNTRYE